MTGSSVKADPCRFCRIYAVSVLAFAALVGVVTTVQTAWGLGKFGGDQYITSVLVLSGVRDLAPGVTGSGLLVAFIVWAHPLSVPQLTADLPRMLKRALLITLPGYLLAATVTVGVGLLLSALAFGAPLASGPEGLARLAPLDVGIGALAALVDAGLIVLLAWRYLARLQAGKSSLPMKLVLAWTFGTGLRMTVGLLLSLLLPG